MDPDELIA